MEGLTKCIMGHSKHTYKMHVDDHVQKRPYTHASYYERQKSNRFRPRAVYTDKFLNGQIVYLCNPLTRNQILLHVYTIQTKCIFQSVFNVQEIKVMSYTGTSFYLLCINCFDQNEQMKHPLL